MLPIILTKLRNCYLFLAFPIAQLWLPLQNFKIHIFSVLCECLCVHCIDMCSNVCNKSDFSQDFSKNNNNKTRIFILKLCNDTHADISFKLKAFSIYITILVPSTCRAFKNAELVLCCLFRSSFDDTECDIFRWEKNCVIWRLCSEK